MILYFILVIVFYMFVQNTSFLKLSFVFLGTTVIGIILAYIGNAISGLAENERFKLMTEEEKQLFFKKNKCLTSKVY